MRPSIDFSGQRMRPSKHKLSWIKNVAMLKNISGENCI